MSKNSALYWLPILQKIVPEMIPESILIEFSNEDIFNLMMFPRKFTEIWKNRLCDAGKKLGYPLFMKSDVFSSKHQWKDTCFVEKEEDIINHLKTIAWHSENINIEMKGVLFRKFLKLQSSFNFFYGDMPISKERRYFVNDNKVICHHAYWDISVFENVFNMDDYKICGIIEPLKKNYSEEMRDKIRSMVNELNVETKEEIEYLSSVANKVAKAFNGEAWSIDFACDVDGKWWLIDAAIASDSYHIKNCKYFDMF